MKASEILRGLADMIDRAESGVPAEEVPKQIQAPKFHKVEVPSEEQGEPYSTMVSPLQQKLELLKKAAGVVRLKHIGPLTKEAIEKKIVPLIASLQS